MIGAVVEIIIGLVIWKLVPGWITEGSKKTKEFLRLACNIVGIIVVIAGSLSLVRSLGVDF